MMGVDCTFGRPNISQCPREGQWARGVAVWTERLGEQMCKVPSSARKGDGLGRGSRGMRGAGRLRGTACLLVMGGIRRGALGDLPSPRGLRAPLYAGGWPVSMPWGSSGVRYWLLASLAAPCRGPEARAAVPRGAGKRWPGGASGSLPAPQPANAGLRRGRRAEPDGVL
jgi:hypothetical protein